MSKKFFTKLFVIAISVFCMPIALAITCPSISFLQGSAPFIKAVHLANFWGIYSETFAHEGKVWNVYIQMMVEESENSNSSKVIEKARNVLARSKMPDASNIVENEKLTLCNYIQPAMGSVMWVTSPPYYGPIG